MPALQEQSSSTPLCKNADKLQRPKGRGLAIWLTNKPHFHWKQKHKSDENEKFAHNAASISLLPTITSLICKVNKQEQERWLGKDPWGCPNFNWNLKIS